MNTQIAAEDETKYFYMMERVALLWTSFVSREHRRRQKNTEQSWGEREENVWCWFSVVSVDVVQKWWEKWSWCEKWTSLDGVGLQTHTQKKTANSRFCHQLSRESVAGIGGCLNYSRTTGQKEKSRKLTFSCELTYRHPIYHEHHYLPIHRTVRKGEKGSFNVSAKALMALNVAN